MSKTRFIKDKKGQFAGSIGSGKNIVPMSIIPEMPQSDVAPPKSEIFTQLGDWAEKLDNLIIKQVQGRHNPYTPVYRNKDGELRFDTDGELPALHTRAIYHRPCSGCGTEDPNLRYRSGASSYCYDCASYNALKQRSKNNGWEEIPTKDEFLDWRRGQKRVCYYCGIADKDVYKQGVKNTRAGGNIPESLGNDRWDSNRPYIIDNMVLSCFACNQLKSNTMTGDEFVKYFGEPCTRRSKDMVELFDKAHQWCCASN
jgi:hypothetical protein